LSKSQAQYLDLYENANDAVFTTDLMGNITSANRVACALLGYTREETITKCPADILTPEGYTSAMTIQQKALAEKSDLAELQPWEFEAVKKDGSQLFVEVRTRLVWEEGRVVGTQAIARDITERKHAEESLRRGERFLANIFSSIQDGVNILDQELNIIHVNPTMERWHVQSLPLVGKKCYVVYHGRNEPCLICPARQTLATGQSASEVVLGTGLDGTVVGTLDLHTFPLIDAETGETQGVIEYVRDATERKRTEEALRRREVILQAVSFTAEQFLKASFWEQNIPEVLARLGKATGVSRVYIFENQVAADGRQLFSQRYEWVASGITAQIDNPQLQGLDWVATGFALDRKDASWGSSLQSRARTLGR
jgi:PAS domain S-box-containing protein